MKFERSCCEGAMKPDWDVRIIRTFCVSNCTDKTAVVDCLDLL